ncbi:hypothetical protein [Kitasatospora sp. NPDC005856]|uniref:hypothetical protein n=1 Tax=Kitasatospora sp. NPDC005856 TaxID=3154566 RepID=UPI0033E6E900
MSVLATFHTAPPLTGRRHTGLRTALIAVADRLAASPLDSPVLNAVDAQAPAGPPVRLRARWQAVTAADGATRLEATWHPDR